MKTLYKTLKTLSLLLSLAAIALFTSCGGDSDSSVEPDDDSQLDNPMLLFTNPTDPNLLMVENDTATVLYSGKKDFNGIPTSLDNVFYHDNRTNEDISISFEDGGAPTKAISSSGESIEFIYENGELVRLLLTSEGGIRVTLPLESDAGRSRQDIQTRSGRIEILSTSSNSSRSAQFAQEENNLFLDIERCNFPLQSPDVSIELKGNSNTFSTQIFGEQVAPGRYGFKIPQPEATLPFNAESYCDGVTGTIENVCKAVSLVTAGGKIDPLFICPIIAAAFAATPIPGDEVIVFTGCERILRVLGKVCAFVTIGVGTGDLLIDETVDLPSLGISDACGLLDALDDQSSTYEITPKVFIPGEGFEELSNFVVDANGPFMDQNYNISGQTNFASFAISPADPAPGQSYIASAEIECAAIGATATITVVGTDGFSDSRSISVSDSFTEITLSVPGAQGGVQDVITLELSTGESTSVAIVF